MTVTILSGSSRINNNTLRLALAMKQILQETIPDVRVIDFQEYDIPFLNKGELHGKGETPFQQDLITSWNESKLLITLSPEYNWFPSAELVNMIHQLGHKGFNHLFENKLFAFCGVSTGRGGRLPAVQLSGVFEKVIAHLHCHSIISPKKFEGHYISRELDPLGKFLGEGTFEQTLRRFLDYNVQLAVKFS
ncbi:MAG: NAD(P)H-dependent oxidoreductase [Flavobacteriales bacterium]|nr:NAD(P)H-dependent oxidoreductase [Flavobacteriales bacterium]